MKRHPKTSRFMAISFISMSFIKRSFIGFFLLLTTIGMTACAPFDPPTSEVSDPGPQVLVSIEETYRLGSGDRLKITVFGENELTGEYAVNPSGVIDFPLIGEVNARGLSLRDFERDLTKRLKSGYLKDPKISIEVLNFRPFFITGEVRSSGQYPYKAGLTVPEAVAIAGGYTYRAHTRTIVIRRFGQEAEQDIPLQGGRILVYPGDQLRVKERFF
jgi:protein involved in polysaccharide export with SLBB domain